MVERKSDDAQYFNRRSLTYENSLEQWFFFDRIQKATLNMVEKVYTPEVVLDIGCGTGRLLRKVRERWPKARLIGVDAATGMIENARKLTPDATFYVSKAESLPLPDTSVDLVLSTASFHHWQDKDKALSEIKRVLRLGGRFFLADIWPPLGLSRFSRHFQANNPSRIREAFADAGLQVQDQKRRLRLWLLITIGQRASVVGQT
jgi:ubiquinone/menaquinone biosynthesis C-methylase UbiE